MANVFIKEETMKAIGNSIRGKNGSTDLYLPEDMPAQIDAITVGDDDPLIIEDMSYFFERGVRLPIFEQVNEKLCPQAKNMSHMLENLGFVYANRDEFPALVINTQNAEDLSYLLANNSYAYILPVLTDSSKCKTMQGILKGSVSCAGTKDFGDIPLWDTSSVEDMSYAFYGCETYLFKKTGTFPAFNLSNVLTMAYMCYGCKQLKTVSILNAQKCTDMQYAFYGCSSLTDVELDLISCKTLSNAFKYCSKLKNVTLNNPDVIEDMSFAFDSSGLESIVLNGLNNVTTLEGAFNECTSLVSAEIDLTACKSVKGMFYGCENLNSVVLKNTSGVENMHNLFDTCTSLANPPVLDMTSCTNAQYMYIRCSAMEEIGGIYAPETTTIADMFRSCTSLKKIDGLRAPKATTANAMLRYCAALEELLNLDFSSITGTSSTLAYFAGNGSANLALKRLTWAPEATAAPTYSIKNCKFTKDALVEMFESLPTLADGVSRTITITGNPGTEELSDEEKAIATGKGYTLTV